MTLFGTIARLFRAASPSLPLPQPLPPVRPPARRQVIGEFCIPNAAQQFEETRRMNAAGSMMLAERRRQGHALYSAWLSAHARGPEYDGVQWTPPREWVPYKGWEGHKS
jgi:hypothetical protein